MSRGLAQLREMPGVAKVQEDVYHENVVRPLERTDLLCGTYGELFDRPTQLAYDLWIHVGLSGSAY